ncbi:sugar ABC transporter substrate-binding protein [soil metagenome]
MKLILLAASIVLGTAAGCSERNQLENQAQGGEKGRLIGVSFQSMNNPFFVDLNEGLKAVVEARGDKLVTLDAQWNSLKQKNDISDLILQGASAIFINPVNWEGIRGSLIQAKQKGIAIIVVDAPAKDQELVLSTVASDNVQAGRLVAEALAQAGRPAKLAILHLSTNKACIDRVAGFKEVLAKYPDMQIVDVQEGKGTTEGARPVIRDLIGRRPDLNAVFAINDPSALGVISALESAGKLGGVKVVAVDGAPEAITAIQNGKMLATSAQFPKEIGKAAAEVVYQHFDGKPVEKEVKIRVELITRDNVISFLKKS